MPDDDVSDFPKYESTVADIKKEVGNGIGDFDIPVRNKDFSSKKMANVDSDFSSESQDVFTSAQSVEPPTKRFNSEEGKPLFVKIDSYKQIMHTLDLLKDRLADAEDVLRALDGIRDEEDRKLDLWKKDIGTLKEKLLSIDKTLFEV